MEIITTNVYFTIFSGSYTIIYKKKKKQIGKFAMFALLTLQIPPNIICIVLCPPSTCCRKSLWRDHRLFQKKNSTKSLIIN